MHDLLLWFNLLERLVSTAAVTRRRTGTNKDRKTIEGMLFSLGIEHTLTSFVNI